MLFTATPYDGSQLHQLKTYQSNKNQMNQSHSSQLLHFSKNQELFNAFGGGGKQAAGPGDRYARASTDMNGATRRLGASARALPGASSAAKSRGGPRQETFQPASQRYGPTGRKSMPKYVGGSSASAYGGPASLKDDDMANPLDRLKSHNKMFESSYKQFENYGGQMPKSLQRLQADYLRANGQSMVAPSSTTLATTVENQKLTDVIKKKQNPAYKTMHQSGWVKNMPGSSRLTSNSQMAAARSLAPAVSPERRVEVMLAKNALGVTPAVRKMGSIIDEEDTMRLTSTSSMGNFQVQDSKGEHQLVTHKSVENLNLRQWPSATKSTLARKLRYIQNADVRTQDKLISMFGGLNKSYVKQQIALSAAGFALEDPHQDLQISLPFEQKPVSYAALQMKASSYVVPPFQVDYNLVIPKELELKGIVKYKDFVRDCLEYLKPALGLAVDEYQGNISKNQRNGQGMLRLTNGDVYRGNFKNDQRSGAGSCMFASGAIFKGEWREDAPHGTGILYSGNNEIIECRFEKGAISDRHHVKILLSDGQYYEGGYLNHRRHGPKGKCYYSNGDMYDGEWEQDRRISRHSRMVFSDMSQYKGQFIDDRADGNVSIEDAAQNHFQVEQGIEDKGKDTGSLINGRLQNRCSVNFKNGDKFIGNFKDGRPYGYGEMYYKNSLPSSQAGMEFEQAQYKGNFRAGQRDGKGKMIWADGSVFDGTWCNDERVRGRMIMANGFVYDGSFKHDKFHGDNEKLMMVPTMVIYQGQFRQGKTSTVGMLLYPDGDIYYGQLRQMAKHGVGKLILYNGSFQEGTWEQEKLSGQNCRTFDSETGNYYMGNLDDSKKIGYGKFFDAEKDEVYEGEFENDKRAGEGTVFRRNGEVLKGIYRNNFMEGDFQDMVPGGRLSPEKVDKLFKQVQLGNPNYVSINKHNEQKVQDSLRKTANKNDLDIFQKINNK